VSYIQVQLLHYTALTEVVHSLYYFETMQSLRLLSAAAIATCRRPIQRYYHATPAVAATTPLPWFVDPEDPPALPPRTGYNLPPHLAKQEAAAPAPLPDSVPEHLKLLHRQLSKSPHLETSTLLVCPPPSMPIGPGLPPRPPRGARRLRGGTYSGEGIPMADDVGGGNGLWRWWVVAQVKRGTENRGAIESVIRVVRKTVRRFICLVYPYLHN
jgi:hypothetical protein